jgi:hypothetical protein
MHVTVVKEYCIKFLAHLLFKSVTLHPSVTEPRNNIDWKYAEEFLITRPDLVPRIARELSAGCDYETFEKKFGEYVLQVFLGYRRQLVCLPPYGDLVNGNSSPNDNPP